MAKKTDFHHGRLLFVLRKEAGLKQQQAADRLDKHLVERTRFTSKAAIRTAISQFETGARLDMPHVYRVAITEAFTIPLDWFTIPWRTEAQFRRELRKHRASGGVVQPPTIEQVARQFSGASLVGALPLPDIAYDSVSRRGLFDRFRSELQAARPSILVVEGLSGYGKSSFVSLAIAQLDRTQQRRLVVAVKCAERTTDQIISSITDLVLRAETRIDPEDPAAFFEHIPTVVILDDADKIAGVPELGGAPVSGARLSELFAAALLKRANLKIVLIMRSSDGPAAALFDELSGLTRSEPVAPFRLVALSTEDVAAIIHKKLKFDNNASARFAAQIGGDPMVVSQFVAIGGTRRRRTVPWLEFVASSLAMQEVHEASDQAQEMRPLLDALRRRSRTSFLTAAVLAFAPGSLELMRCERLVELLAADRVVLAGDQSVPNDTVQAVLSEVLDDFTTTTSTQIELHSRVRSAFKALITEQLGENGLRMIHRRMAEAVIELAAIGSPNGPTPPNLAAYHAIVHHLITLYWLAPDAAQEEILIQPKRMARDPSTRDLAELADLLGSAERLKDRAEIANVAFAAMILSRVDSNDGGGIVSRQFGDYERKLRMLAMFTREGLTENSALTPLVELAPPYTVQLLLDIAICASQAGLLEVAREAIRSRPNFQQEWAMEHLGKIRVLLEGNVDDQDPELGRLIQFYDADTEYLNVHSTVLVREGQFGKALALIRDHADNAREMVALVRVRRESAARLSRRSRLPLAGLLVACRRMLAKRANLHVLDGDMAGAKKWFGIALQVDGLRHKAAAAPDHMPSLFPEHAKALSGEPGRTYCTMYMHAGSPEDLDRAGAAIADNVARALKQNPVRHHDLIDWLVLRSSLERLLGLPTVAAKTMKEVQKLRSRYSVNISFSATIILSLEEERQRIRSKDWRGSSRKLEWLYRAADDAGHKLLACDAALMLAESAASSEDRNLWRTTAGRVAMAGYGFRQIDLERIDASGPFADLL